VTAERLGAVHRRMVRASHLPFVPTVHATTDGQSVVAAGQRVWDLCRWMPGAADYYTNPTPARLANACAALAQLHGVWRPAAPVLAPASSIRVRLRHIARWRDLATGPCVPVRPCAPALEDAVRWGWRVARAAAGATERLLRDWDDWPVFVQPVLRDVWGAHVLFTGDAVAGVIDYGSVKDDHVAVDLARLLGDLVEDDDASFAAGLDAYRAAGGVLEVPSAFVRLLDRTGAVCAVMTWLVRLCGSDYTHPDPEAITARLARLAARVERLFPG
jgi:Ser/Thr protein kinase RdoA (MazF antagonist)